MRTVDKKVFQKIISSLIRDCCLDQQSTKNATRYHVHHLIFLQLSETDENFQYQVKIGSSHETFNNKVNSVRFMSKI